MPTRRFSIMSTRPKPASPPARLSAATTPASPTSSPSTAAGTPASKLTTISRVPLAVAGETVHSKASSGGCRQGSSSTPASMVRPHRFWSTEYGLSPVIPPRSRPCLSA